MISITNDVDGARVEELKVVEKEEDVVGENVFIAERLEVSTQRVFEVEDGGKSIRAEPGFDMWEGRDALDLDPHPT